MVSRVVLSSCSRMASTALNDPVMVGSAVSRRFFSILLHLQQVLDPPPQSLQRPNFPGRWCPRGWPHHRTVAGDALRVGLVGLGAAEFALDEGGDLRGVDDADAETLRGQAFGERNAVSAGGFHTNGGARISESRQPFGEEREAFGRVIESVVAVFAVGEASDIEFGFGDIHADNDWRYGILSWQSLVKPTDRYMGATHRIQP